MIIDFCTSQFHTSAQIAPLQFHPMIWFLSSVTMALLVVAITLATPSTAKTSNGLNLMISMSLRCLQKLYRIVKLMFCSIGR